MAKQVGTYALAITIALVAFFVYLARDESGRWRISIPRTPLAPGGKGISEESPVDAAMKAAAQVSRKSQVAREQRKLEEAKKVSLPPDVEDAATGIRLPRNKRFASSRLELTCLGAGVRTKSVAVASFNVYTVGLYIDPKAGRGALKKFSGVDESKLKGDKALYGTLGSPGFMKYLHLVFARSLPAQKVAEALTSVEGTASPEILGR